MPNWLFNTLLWVQFTCFSLVTILGAALKTKPEKFGRFSDYVEWVIENTWWLIVPSA